MGDFPFSSHIEAQKKKIKQFQKKKIAIEGQIQVAKRKKRELEKAAARSVMRKMLPDWSKISIPSSTHRCPPYDDYGELCFVCGKGFEGHKTIHHARPIGPDFGILSGFSGSCDVHDECLPKNVYDHVHCGLL